MTTFDDREKTFERKFIHDKELALQVHARRNKLLGQWAASKLGKNDLDADQYAREMAVAALEPHDKSHDIIAERVHQDLTAGGIAITLKEIRIEMERLFTIAHEQVAGS